jgi:hypothetical protein
VTRRLILCEGPDDREFFVALLAARQELPRFRVKHNGTTRNRQRGGNSSFVSGLRAYYELEGPFDQVLIVSDNDEDPNASFAKVRSQVLDYFQFAPDRPRVFAGNRPKAMILMLPWDDEPGNLELACLEAAQRGPRRLTDEVERFALVCRVDDWNSAVKPKEMRLRSNLAVRCERDPFVTLRNVFSNPAHAGLVPLNDPSFNGIGDVLATFAE